MGVGMGGCKIMREVFGYVIYEDAFHVGVGVFICSLRLVDANESSSVECSGSVGGKSQECAEEGGESQESAEEGLEKITSDLDCGPSLLRPLHPGHRCKSLSWENQDDQSTNSQRLTTLFGHTELEADNNRPITDELHLRQNLEDQTPAPSRPCFFLSYWLLTTP